MNGFARFLLACAFVLATGSAGAAESPLGPGDVVRLSVYGNPDLAIETRIGDAGTITFPLIVFTSWAACSVPAPRS